ncbi:MAG: hypothetical protein RLZZ142_2711, partial [Verrucomicrobiota bacterium]
MSSLPPKKRVFIVDDEVGFTRLLRLTLEKTGSYLVREENHGPNALESAKSFRPDIIFLDVVMPELEGGEIAKILRAEPTLASVPIVFLTAIVSQRETRTDIQG